MNLPQRNVPTLSEEWIRDNVGGGGRWMEWKQGREWKLGSVYIIKKDKESCILTQLYETANGF